MAAPITIRFDQSGLSAGVAGQSRTDGLLGVPVTVTDPANLGAGTVLTELIGRPLGSAAAVSNPTSPTASFTPDVRGTYIVRRTFTDAGGSAVSGTTDALNRFNSSQGGFAVLLANGFRLPAPGETQQFSAAQGWNTALDPIIRGADARLPSTAEKGALPALTSGVGNIPSAGEKTDLGQLAGAPDGVVFYSQGGRVRRLAAGADGQALLLSGGLPAWGMVAGGGGGTLDASYDFGGAGAGRTVNVDSGAVRYVAAQADNNNVIELDRSPGATGGGNLVNVAANANYNGVPLFFDSLGTRGDIKLSSKTLDAIGPAAGEIWFNVTSRALRINDGLVNRSVKFERHVNIMESGAHPTATGVANRAALVTATGLAIAAGSGTKVYIPLGQFDIDITAAPSGTSIITFSGSGVVDSGVIGDGPGSILRTISTAPTGARNLVEINNSASRVELSDFTIDGNRTGLISPDEQTHGIQPGNGTTGCKNVHIHDMWFKNLHGDGIRSLGSRVPARFNAALAGTGVYNAVLEAHPPGVIGNSFTFALIADSPSGVTINETETTLTVHYQPGVSTKNNVSAAINTSNIMLVRTAATSGGVALGAGDGFAATVMNIAAVDNWVENLEIDGCFFLDCKRSGIGIQRGTRRVMIQTNYFEGGTDQQIDFEPTGNGAPVQFVITGNVLIHPDANPAGISMTVTGNGSRDPLFESVIANNLIINGTIYGLNLVRTRIINNIIIGTPNGVSPESVINLFRKVDDVTIAGNYLERPAGALAGQVISITSSGGVNPTRIAVVDNHCVQRTSAVVINFRDCIDAKCNDNRIDYYTNATNADNGIDIATSQAAVTIEHTVCNGNIVRGNLGGGQLLYGIAIKAQSPGVTVGRVTSNDNAISGCQQGHRFETATTYLHPPVVQGNNYDVVQAPINLPAGLAVVLAGNYGTGSTTMTMAMLGASGAPEGVITARPGTMLMRMDSTGGTYLKTSGTGNTGWDLLGVGGSKVMHKETDPASVSYLVGINTVSSFPLPAGAKALDPKSWTLPPTIGNVQPGVRFTFSDTTTVVRSNTTGAPITETRDSVEFSKDGLAITQIDFVATNVGGSAQSQDLGVFRLDGQSLG